MEISEGVQNKNKDDLMVSYEFNSLYPSAQMDINNTWLKTETAYLFEIYRSDAVCSLLNSGRWIELNRCAFLTVKYQNPWKLVFQHFPGKGKINNP